MHDAGTVANTLLDLDEPDGNRLDSAQLIKIVYFCHAWMLTLHRRPIIKQSVEAWRYAPAIRDVHNAFKQFHDQPVASRAKHQTPEYDDAKRHIIEQTYQKYGYLTAPRTPWDITRIMAGQRRTIDPVGTSVIPNWMLAERYAAKDREQATAPA